MREQFHSAALPDSLRITRELPFIGEKCDGLKL